MNLNELNAYHLLIYLNIETARGVRQDGEG